MIMGWLRRRRERAAALDRLAAAERAFYSLRCMDVTDPGHRALFHLDYAERRHELHLARAAVEARAPEMPLKRAKPA